MEKSRRHARKRLEELPLRAFLDIIAEAKITKQDQEILDKKFIEGLSNLEIAEELNYTLQKVNRTIQKAYDKVARII